MVIKIRKKGQLKIQQMTFMLLAVTLFFILVGMFILVFRFSGLKESAAALEEKNAMLLATKLANSPEFSCGEAFDLSQINCIDFDKVLILKNNSDKYAGFWGKDISNIEIRKIYPAENENICSLENYPNCNIIRIYPKDISGYYLWNFVSLCRKSSGEEEGEIYNKCELAKIFIGYEEEI